MGAPHCAMCALMGHRSCDGCGGPCWDADGLNERFRWVDPFGRELCGYCAEDAGLVGGGS